MRNYNAEKNTWAQDASAGGCIFANRNGAINIVNDSICHLNMADAMICMICKYCRNKRTCLYELLSLYKNINDIVHKLTKSSTLRFKLCF